MSNSGNINLLEPRYTVPDRKYFSEEAIPKKYKELKSTIVAGIRQASRVSVTTDGWTSRITQSYVTITCHYIDINWEICNFVLQTRLLSDSHTGINIAQVLLEAGREWRFADKDSALVSDNASNMTVAAAETKYSKHIKCLAHTLNLASQRALSVNQVSRLLGRVKNIVCFFSTAMTLLKDKQTLLNIPHHRWNSSYDMLERFLEQQPAVLATVISKEVRKFEKDVVSINEDDISAAEDTVTILKPVRTATTVLCSEQTPTISLVYPLYNQLLSAMAQQETDKAVIRDLKAAFYNDLSKR